MIDDMDDRYDHLHALGYTDQQKARLSSKSADEIIYGGIPPEYWIFWEEDDGPIEVAAARMHDHAPQLVEALPPVEVLPPVTPVIAEILPPVESVISEILPPVEVPPTQPAIPAIEQAFDFAPGDEPGADNIADPAARRIVLEAIRSMHTGADKMKAISAASRQLDPWTQQDAIDYLSNVAISLGIPPDAVQLVLEHGQRLREQDREREQGSDQHGPAGADTRSADDGFLCYWHGDVAVEESRRWLVRGTIAEVGAGLVSGQWGMFKTFVVLDLGAALMTATSIFGSEIDRPGGVLFYAAEGESEVPVRFQAAIENRCRGLEKPRTDPQRAPFAWLTPEKVSLNLLDPKSVEQFALRARKIDAAMQKRFGVPLVVMFVDTVVATAGYRKSGDENDPVLNARIMRDGLGLIARKTHTFAFGVDHFGKETQTGTRGSSAKEDNSDTVLAALGERSITGAITKPLVAVRKVRGGISGREYPFTTRIVPVGNETTLVIDWKQENVEAPPRPQTDVWGNGDGMKTLHRVLLNADPATASTLHPWPDSPKQSAKAFKRDAIKEQFAASYPAEGESREDRKEATRKAFARVVKEADKRGLIGCLTIDDVPWIWLGKTPPDNPKEPHK